MKLVSSRVCSLGVAAAIAVSVLCVAKPSHAQVGGTWTTGGGGTTTGWPQPPPRRPSSSRRATDLEMGVLYGTSIGYGVGLGVWVDAEAGISDPAVALIPPAILGVAAPIGVYFLDDPPMERGMPAAIAAGMAIGAGEGLGIASYQWVTADEEDAWGFRGLARSVAIGATLGGAGGFAMSYFDDPPSPKSTMLVASGTLWGTAIGSMFGYGASEGGVGYGNANDDAALGGLIGFNVALAGTGALSMAYIPTWGQLAWMWVGAGVGFAASLPVYIFYAGEDSPPAKRGLLFQGTATTLGILAGAVFGADAGDEIGESDTRFIQAISLTPMAVPGGAGLQASAITF